MRPNHVLVEGQKLLSEVFLSENSLILGKFYYNDRKPWKNVPQFNAEKSLEALTGCGRGKEGVIYEIVESDNKLKNKGSQVSIDSLNTTN